MLPACYLSFLEFKFRTACFSHAIMYQVIYTFAVGAWELGLRITANTEGNQSWHVCCGSLWYLIFKGQPLLHKIEPLHKVSYSWSTYTIMIFVYLDFWGMILQMPQQLPFSTHMRPATSFFLPHWNPTPISLKSPAFLLPKCFVKELVLWQQGRWCNSINTRQKNSSW